MPEPVSGTFGSDPASRIRSSSNFGPGRVGGIRFSGTFEFGISDPVIRPEPVLQSSFLHYLVYLVFERLRSNVYILTYCGILYGHYSVITLVVSLDHIGEVY